MTSEKASFKLLPRHQALLALIAWGILTILLLRHDAYGLDEVGSRALLLAWSVADEFANVAVLAFGVPDLRTLLFLPIGFLWPSNLLAAKALGVVALALAARFLYAARSRTAGSEAALLATGLLLLSPLALAQIDSLASGTYLLAAFGIGAWLDVRYRANARAFNGWFFGLLGACAFSASLHPAGLALPLALGWSWRTLPQSRKFQNFFLAGLIFAPAFILAMRGGWHDLTWMHNPVFALSSVFTGSPVQEEFSWAAQWLPGVAVIALALFVGFSKWRNAWGEVAGRSLLAAMVLGAFVGDHAWAILVLAFVLYYGLPMLVPEREGKGGARTALLVAVFACTTIFMLADKAYYMSTHHGPLSVQDGMIRNIAQAAAAETKAADAANDGGASNHFMVASQWPGRTMIACKCDVLPLPPTKPHSPQKQLATLRGIDYMLFNPKQTSNLELAHNLALLGGAIETVSLKSGGVIVRVHQPAAAQPAPAAAQPAPAATPAKKKTTQ